MVTPSEGARAVRLARESIDRVVRSGPDAELAAWAQSLDLPPVFDRPQGVFVTLRTRPTELLRGCVGFPQTHQPLRLALPSAARSAALDDPRFLPVAPEELAGLSVEVSLLTVPTRVEVFPRERLPGFIKLGTDGLIIGQGRFSGLLLPQVAVEQEWNAAQFLDETCVKAGLPPGSWLSTETSVLRFQCEVFREGVSTTPEDGKLSSPSGARRGRPRPARRR
jgi:uncharacterized protein